MKKKVVALTLSAVLALSSTSAFAAEVKTNCTNTKFNNGLFNNYASRFTNANNRYNFKVTINGKSVDLNSIDCKNLLNNYKPVETKPEATKPVETKPEVTAPEVTKPVETKPEVTKPVEETKPEVTTPEVTKPVETETPSSNLTYEEKVVELVNIERQKAGLSALTLDSSIANVARIKSQDMATNKYFAHQSPTYGSAGDMLTKFGISWRAWGENIASGQKTPEAVVNAWMNSSGHRANIMSSNFSRIGVGYVTNSGGTPYWTQIFAN